MDILVHQGQVAVMDGHVRAIAGVTHPVGVPAMALITAALYILGAVTVAHACAMDHGTLRT